MPDMSPHAILVMALKNTRAMTTEAKQVVDRQLDRFDHYPELRARLQARSQVLSAQGERLETVLNGMAEKTSSLKELVTSLVGMAAMFGHGATGDEVLKDVFVDTAFAGMAVAAYDSLFAIAEAVGEPEVANALRASREEEKEAYDWMTANVAAVSRTYVGLTATAGTSSH